MKRFEGVGVQEGARIAVVANDAIGNFAVATPILQMLRSHYAPSRLDYWGGARTLELQEASDLFDWSYPLHHTPEADWHDAIHERLSHGQYDLVVNIEQGELARRATAMLAGSATFVCGPVAGDLPYPGDARGDLWRDQEWISETLTAKYPFLETPFIAEIFCRLAYLEGPVPPYLVPKRSPERTLPPVLIATAASLPEKLWPLEKWVEALRRLRGEGFKAGLLGAKPSAQKEHWKGTDAEHELVEQGVVEDLRGSMSLPQVVGALSEAKLVLTLDNGILHLAAASQSPTVGLFRYGIHRLWAPPSPKLTVLTPAPEEQVASIEVDAVWEAIRAAL